MSRKVAVFTGNRAEYGLLYWLLREVQASESLDLQLIVGAMHFSPEFGETWRQIVADGFAIDARIEMLLSSNSSVGVVKSIGLGTISAADAFARLQPDLLVILGDRFEALSLAQAALIMQIPIAHIHGGEITEGAYDDAIRHAITKMASIHFVAAEPYRRRVIQMGELDTCVHNFGSLGIESARRTPLMSKQALANSLDFEMKGDYFLITYHPATAADEDPEVVIRDILLALDTFADYQLLFTYPNGDNGGWSIISALDEYVRTHHGRAIAVKSMGHARYLGAMKSAAAVVGNSSSGIIEAPSFGVPTVNIGSRQGGRLSATSVLHCAPTREAISQAIAQAVDPEFVAACRDVKNPYGSGSTSTKIARLLEICTLGRKSRFKDLEDFG